MHSTPCAIKACPLTEAHSAGVRPSNGAALKRLKPWARARKAVSTKPCGVRKRVARLMLAYSGTRWRSTAALNSGAAGAPGTLPSSRHARACCTALITVLNTSPPGDCGDTRSPACASASGRPCHSSASAWLAATSMGSQPISEASPQPVRPSAAVTAIKTQLVLAETLKTCVSMLAMVLMAAV